MSKITVIILLPFAVQAHVQQLPANHIGDAQNFIDKFVVKFVDKLFAKVLNIEKTLVDYDNQNETTLDWFLSLRGGAKVTLPAKDKLPAKATKALIPTGPKLDTASMNTVAEKHNGSMAKVMKVRKQGSGRPRGSLGKVKTSMKMATKVMKTATKKAVKKAKPRGRPRIKGYKPSRRTLRRRVFNNSLDHTPSQMHKDDLIKNHRGKIVSKKMSSLGKQRPWMVAVVEARKALGIEGLAMVKKGTPLYNEAKTLYEAHKKKSAKLPGI